MKDLQADVSYGPSTFYSYCSFFVGISWSEFDPIRIWVQLLFTNSNIVYCCLCSHCRLIFFSLNQKYVKKEVSLFLSFVLQDNGQIFFMLNGSEKKKNGKLYYLSSQSWSCWVRNREYFLRTRTLVTVMMAAPTTPHPTPATIRIQHWWRSRWPRPQDHTLHLQP